VEHIGTIVVYIIMACALIGAIASIKDADTGLGKEFITGLHSIGAIFIPVAGIMASIPYLSYFIGTFFGPLHTALGADPSIAATTLIAADMGGYQLAALLAQSPEGWTVAIFTGFMAGATLVFSVPLGLVLIPKKDHHAMALGMMSGFLSVPIGVTIACLIVAFFGVDIRADVATTGEATVAVNLGLMQLVHNILPLTIFCVALAAGLRFLPELMIKGFLWMGKIMYAAITLVLVFSIIEYFTNAFSALFGSWGFDPIIADAEDQVRALEVSGYIGVMLCGAFPMVYLLNRYLAKPMEKIGSSLGLSAAGVAGILAAMANILAMFRLVEEMPAKDKVLVIAFSVCSAFCFGDHLAFSANFQPTLILPLLLGKFGGGISACLLALWLSVPRLKKTGMAEQEA